MKYTVRLSIIKVFLIILFGAGCLALSLGGIWLLQHNTLIGGSVIVLLWILVPLVGILALLLLPLALAMLVLRSGKAIVMDSTELWGNFPGIGKLAVPWAAVRSVELVRKGRNTTVLVFLHKPELYVSPPTSNFKKMEMNHRMSTYGTVLSLPARLFDRPAEEIVEKAQGFLGHR